MNDKNICNINLNKLTIPKDNPNESKTLEQILDILKVTKVGFIKIKGKDFLVKKEYFYKNFLLNIIYKIFEINIHEYQFYKKYEKKINENKLIDFIQFPIEYKICPKFKIYIFSKLDYNLNSFFLKKLNYSTFSNIFQQIITVTYFLNNKLKVFHNDLHQDDKLRNFMVKKNKDLKKKLSYDNINIPINKYIVVMIDFGTYNKNLGFKNNLFYRTKSIKYFYNFEIKSELLIIFYVILINYYSKKDISFKDLYIIFYNKCKKKTLKDLDNEILNYTMNNNNFLELFKN